MNEQRKQILSIIFALAILVSGCAVASGGESGSTDATDVFSLEAVADSTGDAAGNTDASTDADAASDGATEADSTEGATESETSTEATTSTPATEATAATQATEAATEATKATTPTTAATTPSTEATTPATQATQATQAATEATTPATEAATQPATEATEPEETKAATVYDHSDEFGREIAYWTAYYINQYRIAEGAPECTILPGMTLVAEYRANQLTTNYAHDTDDMREALAYYQYGTYMDYTEYGYDESYNCWKADISGEAIMRGIAGDGTAEEVGKRIAGVFHSSSSHWSYLGSSKNLYIGVGLKYESVYHWHCCVIVGTTNYG